LSYQKLSADEVFGLYAAVTRALSVPLCVYDNPGTTQFVFTDELHGQIAQLPNVASVRRVEPRHFQPKRPCGSVGEYHPQLCDRRGVERRGVLQPPPSGVTAWR
jgi:hypothetical protein